MSLENLISVEFTAQELAALETHLQAIRAIIAPKSINLTAEQRQIYGSVAEQNKLFVNKAYNYMQQRPDLIPNVVDKAEFERDYKARTVLEPIYQKLDSLNEMITDTKILLDHDNYHTALSFYRYLRFLSKENEPGVNVIFDDMKQFFSGGRPVAPPTPPAEDDSEDVK